MDDQPEHPADPAATTAPAPDASPATPRRRWPKVVAAVAILLAAIVALLPGLISGSVRQAVEVGGSDALGRQLRVAALALGWTGTTVEGLEVHSGGADSPVLLRVARIEAAPRIGAALGGRYVVDDLLISGPELRLDLAALAADRDAPGTAPDGPAPADVDGAAPATIPPFSVAGRIRDGVITLVHEDRREERLGTFTADFAADRDAPATLTATFDLGDAGRIVVDADAVPFTAGRVAGARELQARLGLSVEKLDAAALAPVLRALGMLDEVAGRLTTTVSARLAAGAVEEGTLALDATGLRARGGRMPEGARIDEPRLAVKGGFGRTADGTVTLHQCTLAAEDLEIEADFAIPPDLRAIGGVRADASLQRLLRRAKDFGLETDAAAVGTLHLEARSIADAAGQRATGSLVLENVQVAPGTDRAPVTEGRITADFDVVRSDEELRIEGVNLKASMATARVAGTLGPGTDADLTVTAAADLEKVLGFASAFGVVVPGRVQGHASVDGVWRRGEGAEGEGRADVVVRDLVVTPEGEGRRPVREAEVRLHAEAVPAGDRTTIRALSLRGAFVNLEAEGDVAADGSDGTLRTRLELDLAPLADLLDGLGSPLPVGLAGRAAWTGPVAWSARGEGVRATGTATVTDLVATLPAPEDDPGAAERVLREASIVADVAVERLRGDLRVEQLQIAGAGLALDATGEVAADGALDLRVAGSVGLREAFGRMAALGFIPRDPATAGTLEFATRIAGDGESPDVTLERLTTTGAPFDLSGTGQLALDGPADLALRADGDLAAIEGLLTAAGWLTEPLGAAGTLTLTTTATATGPEAPLVLALDGALESLRLRDPGGGPAWTQQRIGLTTAATWDRDAGSVDGNAALTTDDGRLDVKGTAGLRDNRQVEAEATLDLDLAGLVRSRPSLVPIDEVVPGRLTGSARLAGPLATPIDLPALVAQARFELDRLKTRPFEATAVVVDAVLTDGVVSTRTLEGAVNGGTVTGRALLALAGAARTEHELALDVQGVAMDGALTELIARVIPIFVVGETGLVTGRLDTRVDLAGSGADWDAVLPTLKGEGTMRVSDGGVVSGSALTDILDLLGKSKNLTFKTVETAFAIHDGRVWNERLVVDGEEHAMVLKGSTTFDGRLDYAVGARSIKMGPKKRERLKPLMDADGNLPFRLAGTLSRPKVKPPDLKDALGNVAEDLLKKKLKDLLGGD